MTTQRFRPTIVRPVEDKKPHTRLPDNGKPQVISKEAEGLNDRPAARGFAAEDPVWISFERALSALKEALGTDDEDFCKGILRLTPAIPHESAALAENVSEIKQEKNLRPTKHLAPRRSGTSATLKVGIIQISLE